jgi:acyl carrier protein
MFAKVVFENAIHHNRKPLQYMTKKEASETILEFIRTIFDDESIQLTMTTRFDDLGCDDFDLIEILSSVGERFGVELIDLENVDEDIEPIKCPEDILKLLDLAKVFK